MNELFKPYISQLHEKFENLSSMSPFTYKTLPKGMPKAGIYVFIEDGKPLYVGRSNNIKKRLGRHSRPSAKHQMAAFAFRIAREQTDNLKATYRKGSGRKELVIDPAFKKAFETAKARIRLMDVRFVEEADPIKQALLEIYIAVLLQTPYNDFDNH